CRKASVISRNKLGFSFTHYFAQRAKRAHLDLSNCHDALAQGLRRVRMRITFDEPQDKNFALIIRQPLQAPPQPIDLAIPSHYFVGRTRRCRVARLCARFLGGQAESCSPAPSPSRLLPATLNGQRGVT